MNSSTPSPIASLPIRLFVMILLFATLSHITADMYIPSLPFITKAFGTTPTAIQYTLTSFMIGFSFAHLVYGPLSDRIGRRLPILMGIAIGAVGGLICLFASSVYILIAGRFVQGIGVAVCNSVGRSFVRDLLSGSHLARIGSHIGMVMVFITATAPTLGGYFQHYLGWRSVFLFLILYSLLVWIVAWKALPETNINLNSDATKLNTLLKNYLILLTHKTFIGYTLCVSFAYAGVIAYVTSAPFLFQTVIGLTPVQFGWLAFIIGASIFLSFFINSQLVLKAGIEKLVGVGGLLMFIAGIIMLILALFGFLNTFVIMLPISIFCVGAGFTFGNAGAGALLPFAHMSGSAGALFGCLQVFGGAIASFIMAKLHEQNQIQLAMVLTLFGLLSLISWKYLAVEKK